MQMTKISICQQDDLDSQTIKREFDKDYPCHVYFICRRPRVRIIPDKCSIKGDLMTLTFGIQKQFEFHEYQFRGRLEMDCSNLRIVSEYPYSKFQVVQNGNVVIGAKSSLYYNMHLREYNSDMDLDVLYVGQSYGENGSRTAPDRLMQHSTLQKIYSEAIQNNPDYEIWLCLLSFDRTMITSIDGTSQHSKRQDNNDTKKAATAMNKFINNELDERQIVNFTEAALIKYFKPIYNKEYKDKFPNPAHKSYSECYDLDVNSICFEMETDCIASRLFSQNISPAFTHLGSFTLETREKRINIFDILDNSFKVENLSVVIE